jgi:signal transduction histidine kinase
LATGSLHPDPLRLKRRLVLQGGGFALLLLCAFAGSVYWKVAQQRHVDQRTELQQLMAAATSQLPLIAHETSEASGVLKFQPNAELISAPALLEQRIQWFGPDGALLQEQGELPLPPGGNAPALSNTQTQKPSWDQWSGGISLWQPVLVRTGPQGPSRPLGSVRVALSDRAAQADLRRLRSGLLLGGIVTSVAALLVGRRMLTAAFWPLQQQVRALERFTADASHELRHPLSALRALLAAVPQELRHQPQLAWRELNQLSAQLSDLVDDLVLLARQRQELHQPANHGRALERFDLMELLEDLIRCYSAQASERSIRLILNPDPSTCSAAIEARSEQILRLFTNLLLNAIRHSPEGGLVTIEVVQAPRQVTVQVMDQGPGIPSNAREQVFERFWRSSDQGGHSGLGLAIARSIARSHGGELSVLTAEPGRCVMQVQLPALQRSS